MASSLAILEVIVGSYTFSDETLGLSGVIGGNAPVQGEGRVFGYPFYFRARDKEWTCAIYLDRAHPFPENLAGAEPFDHEVFFVEWGIAGFVHCGEDENASFIPYERAEQLIRTCAASFIKKMAPSSLLPPKKLGAQVQAPEPE